MPEELIDAAALTFRFIVGFVLLTASVPKLLDRREFERAVAGYALVPFRFVSPIAAWLPRLELVCALALLLGIAVQPVAAVAGVMLFVFALAVAINLARGRRIECGCFSSVTPRRIGWPLVVGDLALAGMALTAAFAHTSVLTLFGAGSATALTTEDGVALLVLASALVLGWLLASTWLSVRSSLEARRPT